jgi:hypothetical protein
MNKLKFPTIKMAHAHCIGNSRKAVKGEIIAFSWALCYKNSICLFKIKTFKGFILFALGNR